MNTFRRLALTTVTVLATGLVLAGCSSQPNVTPEEPIRVAAIMSETPGAQFNEMTDAADAVFQQFNKEGGLNGHPVELTVYGDQGTERGAVAAANKAMSERAVAFIGSSSVYESANVEFYARQKVAVVNYCSEPACFKSSVIAPVNAGPFYETFANLVYASENLKKPTVCAVLFPDTPQALKAYAKSVTQWTALTGKSFTATFDLTTEKKPDLAKIVTNMNDKKCSAVWSNASAVNMLALLKAAELKMYKKFSFFGSSALYTGDFLSSVTWVGAGLYSPANFTPYGEKEDSSLYGWQKMMDNYGIQQNSYSQAGYLAATTFIDTLKSMGDKPATKANVLVAYQGQTTPLTNAMWGNPWIFGPGETHQPNISVWPVSLLPAALGQWTSEGPWLRANELTN